MAQAFNHFVRFLIEHEPKRNQSIVPFFALGSFILVMGLFLFNVSSTLGLILIGVSALCWTVPLAIHTVRMHQKIPGVPAELLETFELLCWLGGKRELNRRTHPELRDLLEELAEIRRTTLDALASDAWKARTKTPDGAQAVKDIEAVLRDALYDSIFIGRHLFRGKGQRETTFAKRCANPEFGRHALVSIGQIRDEMRLLSESALAAGAQSDLRVNLVRERMQALVDAEREVEEVSGFDATE